MAEFPNPLRAGSFRCPAHPDRSPSLSITLSAEGAWLLHCHRGCTADEVLRAAGLTWADLFPAGAPPLRPRPRLLRVPPTLDPEVVRELVAQDDRARERRDEYAEEWAAADRIRAARRQADLARAWAARLPPEQGWGLWQAAAILDLRADELELGLDEAMHG